MTLTRLISSTLITLLCVHDYNYSEISYFFMVRIMITHQNHNFLPHSELERHDCGFSYISGFCNNINVAVTNAIIIIAVSLSS